MIFSRKWIFIFLCIATVGFLALYLYSDLTLKQMIFFVGLSLAGAIFQGGPALDIGAQSNASQQNNSIVDGLKLLFWGFIGLLCIIAFVVCLMKYLDWRDDARIKIKANHALHSTTGAVAREFGDPSQTPLRGAVDECLVIL